MQGLVKYPDPERPVLSEYHDGGSPTGFFMLRKGRWKLVYFAEQNPPLLFNMDDDPRELNNLAEDESNILRQMLDCLFNIMDPEAVNRQAFADQEEMIAKLGGIEAIRSMRSFNHTPIE